MRCSCCQSAVVPTGYRDQFLGNPLVSCATCGHIQVSEVPTPQAIKEYYERQYSQTRSRTVGKPYFAVMARRARAQCDFIEAAGVALRGARVCDIGCGYGALIEELRRRGADAKGVEYDPACVDYCRGRGLSVERITSEEDVAALGPLDVITLSHTLEHVRDVEGFLSRVRERARFVFFEVPHYSLQVTEEFRDQEGHLHFFNPSSLERLLRRCGLEPLRVEACGPTLQFFWSERQPLPLARRVLRTLQRDWFFKQYSVSRPDGMWIRTVARTS